MTAYDVVVPTMGRESLRRTVGLIRESVGPQPGRIIVVDDRADRAGSLPLDGLGCDVVETPGRAGPAAARNLGWRASRAPWIAFLDDDVVVTPHWCAAVADDLRATGDDVAAVQGRIVVPLPEGRAPTDQERGVHGLERATWATADLVCRRAALDVVGGFDERFPRAYREDADLGLRLTRRGWSIVRGDHTVEHPVAEAPWWASVRRQIGNRDDPLMTVLHGRGWRDSARAPAGRLAQHRRVTAAALLALAGHRRAPVGAVLAAVAWAFGTARFAATRIAPGPRSLREVTAMAATSVAIPPVATFWSLVGWMEMPFRLRRPAPTPAPQAVLVDRDGTLIVDVPYNGDPAQVQPMPGASEALARLRAARLPIAVVSNQSGIARGLLTADQVWAVNARVEALLGPFDAWLICPHEPADGCACRKPAPGMVFAAAEELGVAPSTCAFIGDIEADMAAADAAGAHGVLVPTAATLPHEVDRATCVAPDLAGAVDLLLTGDRP